MEVLIAGAIILAILFYNNTIDKKKFLMDNEQYFQVIKEEDYDFLVYVKYGEEVDVDQLYMNRVMWAIIVFIIVFAFTLVSNSSGNIFNGKTLLNLVLSLVIAYFTFKSQYTQLKSFYKKHLNEIDIMLPYYLKSIEILIQHYTVPVALGKSINEAPAIFKPGLRRLIEQINSGDSSIEPYMEFANTYPVRDSMRMMRLLYRLGIGSQERKQERLMMFSKTVSNLQQKAREVKYKERLDNMEKQTMTMLVVTGVGVMVVILISMMMMFSM